MKYIITVAETRVLSQEQNFWLSNKFFPDSNKFAVWNKIPTSWENTLKILDKRTKFLLQKKYYWSMGKILLILSKYKIRNSTFKQNNWLDSQDDMKRKIVSHPGCDDQPVIKPQNMLCLNKIFALSTSLCEI